MSDKAQDEQAETQEWIRAQRGASPTSYVGLAKWKADRAADYALAHTDDGPVRLASIRARLSAASPGPWGTCHVREDGSMCKCGLIWGVDNMVANTRGGQMEEEPGRPEDAQFIAHSRADIEWLLNLVERGQR